MIVVGFFFPFTSRKIDKYKLITGVMISMLRQLFHVNKAPGELMWPCADRHALLPKLKTTRDAPSLCSSSVISDVLSFFARLTFPPLITSRRPRPPQLLYAYRALTATMRPRPRLRRLITAALAPRLSSLTPPRNRTRGTQGERWDVQKFSVGYCVKLWT